MLSQGQVTCWKIQDEMIRSHLESRHWPFETERRDIGHSTTLFFATARFWCIFRQMDLKAGVEWDDAATWGKDSPRHTWCFFKHPNWGVSRILVPSSQLSFHKNTQKTHGYKHPKHWSVIHATLDVQTGTWEFASLKSCWRQTTFNPHHSAPQFVPWVFSIEIFMWRSQPAQGERKKHSKQPR